MDGVLLHKDIFGEDFSLSDDNSVGGGMALAPIGAFRARVPEATSPRRHGAFITACCGPKASFHFS